MNGEARKPHLIEALLKEENENILSEVESSLTKSSAGPVEKKSLNDFADIWIEEEAEKIKKDIEQACGQIQPNDCK